MHLLFGELKEKPYLCTQKKKQDRGVEQLVARQAHNLEVVRSSRASATFTEITSFKASYFGIFLLLKTKVSDVSWGECGFSVSLAQKENVAGCLEGRY